MASYLPKMPIGSLLLAIALATIFTSCTPKKAEPLSLAEAKSIITNVELELGHTDEPSVADKFEANYKLVWQDDQQSKAKGLNDASLIISTADLSNYNLLKSFTIYTTAKSDYYLHFYHAGHSSVVPLNKGSEPALPALKNQGGLITTQEASKKHGITIDAGNTYNSYQLQERNILLGYLLIEDLKKSHKNLKYDVLLAKP